jgi:hypothetical protein
LDNWDKFGTETHTRFYQFWGLARSGSDAAQFLFSHIFTKKQKQGDRMSRKSVRSFYLSEEQIGDQIFEKKLFQKLNAEYGDSHQGAWFKELPIFYGFRPDFLFIGCECNKVTLTPIELKITADAHSVAQLVGYINLLSDFVNDNQLIIKDQIPSVDGILIARHFDASASVFFSSSFSKRLSAMRASVSLDGDVSIDYELTEFSKRNWSDSIELKAALNSVFGGGNEVV